MRLTKLIDEHNDSAIIKRVAQEGKANFHRLYADFQYQNCILHNSNEECQIRDKQQIRTDSELLMKAFIIGSAFEREGFNAKIECKKQDCPNKGREKLNAHAVAALHSLRKIQNKTSLNEMFRKDVSRDWLRQFSLSYKEIRKPKDGNHNPQIEKPLKGFQEFYRNHKEMEVLSTIENKELETSFGTLTKSVKGMGIGPKIAKLIIRDLLLLLRIETEDIKDIELALPVDIWVRRIFLSLPSLFEEFKKKLKPCHLSDMNNMNKLISRILAEKCQEESINPLMFDFGAYFYGKHKLSEKLRDTHIAEDTDKYYQKIYSILLDSL